MSSLKFKSLVLFIKIATKLLLLRPFNYEVIIYDIYIYKIMNKKEEIKMNQIK